MRSPSNRIQKATAQTQDANRRLAAAEKSIARSFIEMIDEDEAEDATNAARPAPPPPPAKNQPPRK